MAPIALDIKQAPQISLSEYVFRRIASLGVHSIFGVPGDFNLSFLEHIYDVPELKWYGCCNELNAAYATDGYSKATGKIGVMITTMGVGELSALNGINGASAEYVPLLHIVGTTPTQDKVAGKSNHHLTTPLNPMQKTDHYVYERIAREVACQVASISNAADAPNQIDDVIQTILTEKKPGYLYIPCDFADVMVDATNLIHRSGESFFARSSPSHQVYEVANNILNHIYNSEKPCILSDVLVGRFGLTDLLQQFVIDSKLPHASTQMGKSILDESNEYYVGDYSGNESAKQVAAYVRSCDLLLHFGVFENETNSGHGTIYDGVQEVIVMHPKYTQIGHKQYPVGLQDLLPVLVSTLDPSKVPTVGPPQVSYSIEDMRSNTPISETDVLREIQRFLRPNDMLVFDTGSLVYGLPDIRLPSGCRTFTQSFYLSIGMGLPCSFGVSVAMKEMGHPGRLIFVEGDGAAQMTIQELSNYNRAGFNPLILLLNNNGYTVERVIKGPTREYNDIRPDWKWTQIFDTFGITNYKCKRVVEPSDLAQTLDEYADADCARLVEIVLDDMDVPWRFHCMLQGSK